MAKIVSRIFALFFIFILVVMTGNNANQAKAQTPLPPMPSIQTGYSRSVEDLPIFKVDKFKAHYHVPDEAQIGAILRKAGILQPGDDPSRVKAAVQKFKQAWGKRNPPSADPRKLAKLLERERKGELGKAKSGSMPPFKVLAVPIEFPGTDTFTYSDVDDDNWPMCHPVEVTTSGPLHNQIAPPGPRDNNSVWYEDTTPDLYKEIFFGTGPDAGVIINHPNLGRLDFRGSTMANYYLEQSEGAFVPTGSVYPKWLQADHSEGWYGVSNCETGALNEHAEDLVAETIDKVNADNQDFPWQDFDGDGDGYVDHYTVIHAGKGEELGGGAQGSLAIYDHASSINWPAGYLACEAGSTGCPNRSIYVLYYSMDAEDLDVGLISEEFGHTAFGLPDIYSKEEINQFSAADWAIMEMGRMNGPLVGMLPAPFPLWFRYLIGWAQPVEIQYQDLPSITKVGQLSLRPNGSEQGIIIHLPDQQKALGKNPLNSGQAWWSYLGDLAENTLTREVDLAGAASPIFSFDSFWNIEQDWDFGYVEVSQNGGGSWISLPDMDGVFTEYNPNSTSQGWGLTGDGSGRLRFDLSSFSGGRILLRLRYVTDMAVYKNGWWADNFLLQDGQNILFRDDGETGDGGWATNGWRRLDTMIENYPLYYLVEWRNLSGFDRGLQNVNVGVYMDEDEWEVDKIQYSTPGALIWLRNTEYNFDYNLSDSLMDPPSLGPKHALTVVDSHFFPYSCDSNYFDGYDAYVKTPVEIGQIQAADATFGLQETKAFTLRWCDFSGGPAPVEKKTFGPRLPASQFHDSLGYYPGLFILRVPFGDFFFPWDLDASVVIPAKESYTTRISDTQNNPLLSMYGTAYEDPWIGAGTTVLGTGNPGDAGVQYGLHLAVLKQAKDGSWGHIAVWFSQRLLKLDLQVNRKTAVPGDLLTYMLTVTNDTPLAQTFKVTDLIPENTTYISGAVYDSQENRIVWTGTVPANEKAKITFLVRVNAKPNSTKIVNNASLTDDALGGNAAIETNLR